ncbi:MAG: PD40 domain-containing protein, partial [Deltaproteobacteria bacterium]|nr:PD40 domain-containing protein [Deltaproteobacteria bacterium]
AILNNKIVYNKQDGVRIAGGSFRNFVVGNLITYHKGDGVVVSGFFSVMNSILSNSITNNTGDGITLDMGNTMIPKPIIRSIAKSSAGTRSIYGEVDFSVPDGSLVEIFIDSQNEGRAWIGSAHTVNRQFFLWNATPPPGESFDNVHFTATVTDNNGNTSEFGGYEPGAVIGCDAPEPPPFEIPILYGVMATLRDSEDVALTDINASDTSVLIEGSPVARDPDVCGGNVVYSSNEEGNFEIYLMDAETKAKTRLTMNSYNDVEPAFSPDCGKIAFASDASGKFKIYTMNKDGSNVQMITGGLEEARTPDFDWQGNKIVFARNVAGDFGIWSVGTDGNGLEEVIDLEGDDMRPKV